MQPESPLASLYHFVAEKAPDAHPTKRAQIYRGLASIIGDENDARTLLERAEECEALERHCRQLTLSFGMPKPRPLAPATYCGIHRGDGVHADIELWNLTAPIAGHPAKSTVSRETIEAAGYRLPPVQIRE